MRDMKHPIRFPTIILFVFIFFRPASSRAETLQAANTEGAQQFAEFGDFRLRNGSAIHDFRLGYRTLGKLNAAKSNAILWPTWLGGKSQDLLQYIGPSNVFDSTRYFVILVDAIGNGVSSSPSNSKSQWASLWVACRRLNGESSIPTSWIC